MEQPIQPIVPEGTPLPTPPVGVPPFPITPFAVWTWSTPVIPEFYWNIYSSEQRIKSICKEIGKIESYLNYLANKVNENLIDLDNKITKLTERVAALEKKVEEEVARLDALIAQLRADLEKEIADREAGDTALGDRIDQEIDDRQHADNTLHEEIAQEVEDRIHGDDQLHGEISQETQARIHADDQLHEEISHRLLPTDVQAGEEISITRPDPNSNTIIIASTVAHSISDLENTVSGIQAALTAETEERRADDAKLWQAVNNRIERGKILAGPGIKVENDPDSSTVTISATGGSGGGSTTVTGTAPVEVTGDPEEGYTVSVSEATEDAAGVITEARVKELAPITLNSNPTASINRPSNSIRQNISYEDSETQEKVIARNISLGPITPAPSGLYEITGSGLVFKVAGGESASQGTSTVLGVKTGTGLEITSQGEVAAKTSTESQAGIISESRVKELAGTVAPSLSAEEPLKLEEGKLSLTKDPAGPVTSSSAGLSVREITPETSSESEAGVVSKATIKSLATLSGGVKVAPYGGLEFREDLGGLTVKGLGGSYNPIGVSSDGDLTLVGYGLELYADTSVIAEPVGKPTPSTSWPNGLWDGRPTFIQDTTSANNPGKAEFVLSSGVFEVQEAGSKTWTEAEIGTFELVSYPDRVLSDQGAAEGFPIYHTLYARITPYGQSYYTPSTTEEGRVKIQGLRVHFAYYNLYVLPVTA